jgi:nitrate reductase cytochrome c-type subunit
LLKSLRINNIDTDFESDDMKPVDLFRFSLLTISTIILLSCNPTSNENQTTPLSKRFDPETQSYAYAIPNLPVPEGISGIKAADCGTCHKTIYEEWRQSTHANALNDIQFQAEITKPDAPKWICLNCHIPLQNQREKMVTALIENDIMQPVEIDNPLFDKQLQKEGVTCATCHVRVDAETGKSFIYGPNGSSAAPHPVKQNAAHLREICYRCHFPMGEGLTPNLICWFYTKTENEAAQPLLKEKFGREMRCVDCHMPETKRLLAEDFQALPERAVNRHTWTGGGVPKWYDLYETLLERGYQPGLEVAVGSWQAKPAEKQHQLSVRLTNSRAGHDLPTGDPERFLKAIFKLTDKAGKILYRDSLRIGQTWQWNPARKMGDNRLKFGETRLWQISVPDSLFRMAEMATIIVYHVRLNSETAQHIRSAENIDESLFENGTLYVRNLTDYYPQASVIFREDIAIDSSKRKRYELSELIKLSLSEKGKPLHQREY